MAHYRYTTPVAIKKVNKRDEYLLLSTCLREDSLFSPNIQFSRGEEVEIREVFPIHYDQKTLIFKSSS